MDFVRNTIRRMLAEGHTLGDPEVSEDWIDEWANETGLRFSWDDVAYVLGVPEEDRLNFHVIRVADELQGQGVARAILKQLNDRYPGGIYVKEVVPDMIYFWDQMQDEGLIADWESVFS